MVVCLEGYYNYYFHMLYEWEGYYMTPIFIYVVWVDVLNCIQAVFPSQYIQIMYQKNM
jgi:hypothetical protein